MNFNLAARWVLGLLLAIPLIVVATFFGYLAYQSWAALETLSVSAFGNGEVLEVTQVASGPIGSGYAYELGYRANAEAELQLVDVWEYPSSEHQVQIHELGDLAVVLTPARDVVHIRTQTGSWKHWRLRELLAFPPLSADLLQVSGHEPRMVIERDLNGDGVAEVMVSSESARNGRAGNIWSVYVALAGSFVPLNDSLSMRTDAVSKWIPNSDSTAAYGITTYHPGSSRQGVLVTYALEDGRLTSSNTPVRPADSSENPYLTAMAQENLVPISELNTAEALAKLQQE